MVKVAGCGVLGAGNWALGNSLLLQFVCHLMDLTFWHRNG